MLQNYNFYRVLEIFIESPTKSFGWRELSENIHLAPLSIKRYVEELLKEGIIVEKRNGRRKMYAANRESRKYRIFMAFDTAMKLENCSLTDFLNKQYGYPTIILFGSFSNGEATEESDIDIAVITESKKTVDLSAFKKALKREVQVFRFTKKGLESLKKENPSLFEGIINGHVLSGRLEVI